MFPKSPTWRSESPGPPWSFFNGLKWGPNRKRKPAEQKAYSISKKRWIYGREREKGNGGLPVELQPFVVSPRAWIWKPWSPGESPLILPLTWVAPVHIHHNFNKKNENPPRNLKSLMRNWIKRSIANKNPHTETDHLNLGRTGWCLWCWNLLQRWVPQLLEHSFY